MERLWIRLTWYASASCTSGSHHLRARRLWNQKGHKCTSTREKVYLMPTYEYICKPCNRALVILNTIEKRDEMPTCGNCNEFMSRQISQSVGAIFKGTGWGKKWAHEIQTRQITTMWTKCLPGVSLLSLLLKITTSRLRQSSDAFNVMQKRRWRHELVHRIHRMARSRVSDHRVLLRRGIKR